MKNKKAQIQMIWVIFVAMILLVVFALISPMKDILSPVVDDAIADGGLNCGTPTAGYRGVCIVVKGAMLWFVLSVIYYAIKFLINVTTK